MSTLEKDIADLVRAITKRAKDKDTPFCEAIDALKAITAYTAAKRKFDSGRVDEDSDESSFVGFRQDIDEAEVTDGAAAIRGRRGRQPS